MRAGLLTIWEFYAEVVRLVRLLNNSFTLKEMSDYAAYDTLLYLRYNCGGMSNALRKEC